MKNKVVILLTAIAFLLTAALLFACKSARYIVFFDSNGGSKVNAVTTDGASVIDLPVPVKENYAFEGWFYDNGIFKKPFTSDSLVKNPIKRNLTVYAKWGKAPTKGLRYEYDEKDKAYTVIGLSGSSQELVIAHEYNGFPVTKIASNAFLDKTEIVSVTVPHSIVEIGEGAFKGCSSIKEMSLPFVGKNREIKSDKEAVFGHIFGRSETLSLMPYTFTQQYAFNSFSFYYVPLSLQYVEITDARALSHGAFTNLSNIIKITLNEGLEEIADFAFMGCRNLGSVYLPHTVKKVGADAFESCPRVKIFCQASSMPSGWAVTWNEDHAPVYWNIDIDDIIEKDDLQYLLTDENKLSLINCISVAEEVSAPSKVYGLEVVAVKQNAFLNNDKILSLTLPDTVKEMEMFAVKDCPKLTSLSLPFAGKSDNSSGNFGYIFGANNHLSNKSFVPQNIKKVEIRKAQLKSCAFMDCSYIEEIVLPSQMDAVADSAFINCSKLQAIELPKGLTKIGDNAFAGCVSLTELSLPSSVNEIGKYAFSGCEKLSSINIPQGITVIKEYAFNKCQSLPQINLPSSVVKIEKYAFAECAALSQADLPQNLAEIKGYAFYKCQSLSQVYIGNKVSYIGERAYAECANLTFVYIPNSVIAVGVQAFMECNKLTIYCQAPSKPSGFLEQWNGRRPVYYGYNINE
ncbi:MAG TPA: leucine-rich repeat protein [Clostridiales bacterium]|nr:leucine-rich repeat protein [Clostridiales bacterium]